MSRLWYHTIRMKNALITALTAPFRKPKPTQDPNRILVVSTTGLGDTLWSTPALRALKTHLPNSYLATLTSPVGAQVLKNNPHVDCIWIAREPLPIRLPSLITNLRKEQFDTILIFHTSQRLILPLCTLLGASTIAGTTGINKGLDHLLTHPIPPSYEHEIARRLRITQAINVPSIGNQTLDWFISDCERIKALQIYSEFNKPIVALHPGSKDRFKQWPPSHFAELGKLLKQADLDIMITGNLQEAALAQEISDQIPGARCIAGNHSLRTFAALLKYIDLFITNDTGPMHIAFAHNTPTIALFSPTDPSLCGPHHAKHCKILSQPPTCNPCLRKRCFDPFCMRQIGPEEVMDHVKQFYIETSYV